MKAHALTAALFVLAAAVAVLAPPRDRARDLAETLLGPAERLAGDGPPAFRAGERAVLFFERPGFQGLIRGALVLDGARIADVVVLSSVEGPDGRAFDTAGFLTAFRGRPARPPVVVDAVSGASISSRALADAVNERLKWWASRRPDD